MKERLTGAIILVVLIVLLVPELLSGPSRSVSAAPAAVASSEDPPLRSYTINLADDAHPPGAAGTSATPAQASGPAQPTPITESPPQTPTESPEAGTADQVQGVTQSAATSAPTPPATNEAAASAKDPQPTISPPLQQHSSPTPTPQRSVAPEKLTSAPQRYASTDRHSATDHSAADHAAPAQSAATTGGWEVQLGVFSVQANAERLAQELKSQGFHALVSQTSGRRPMWRVRTGPVAEHAAAEQLSARLRAAGHAGSIVPK